MRLLGILEQLLERRRPPATTSTSTSPAETSASSTSAGKPSSAGTTAPGTVLSPGATAVVNFEPESTNFRLQISVVSIKKGSQADMNGVELDKAQRSQTPYYVTQRVQTSAAGTWAPTTSPRPMSSGPPTTAAVRLRN